MSEIKITVYEEYMDESINIKIKILFLFETNLKERIEIPSFLKDSSL